MPCPPLSAAAVTHGAWRSLSTPYRTCRSPLIVLSAGGPHPPAPGKRWELLRHRHRGVVRDDDHDLDAPVLAAAGVRLVVRDRLVLAARGAHQTARLDRHVGLHEAHDRERARAAESEVVFELRGGALQRRGVRVALDAHLVRRELALEQ